MLFAYNSEICIILSVIDNNYYNFKILMNCNTIHGNDYAAWPAKYWLRAVSGIDS